MTTPSGGTPAAAGGEPRSAFDVALDRLDRLTERISFALFRFGIFVTMPALVVLVSLDVALRYLFNAPLQWARDVNGLLLLITIFCALPHAWDRSYHIRMEVFYSRFRTATRRRADVLASLAGLLVFGMMTIQAVRFVPFMMRTGETGEDLEFVLWPFMAVLAFCAIITAARILANPSADSATLRHPTVTRDPEQPPGLVPDLADRNPADVGDAGREPPAGADPRAPEGRRDG